jgi:repressor LexA
METACEISRESGFCATGTFTPGGMVMKKILTKRQQDILDFVESFLQKHGYPPTLREIGNAFGISSTNGVRVNLAALEKKKYIIRHPWLSRGIELIYAPKTQQVEGEIGYVPIIGKVAAGEPIFAAENIEGMLAIDDSFLPTKKVFALKVKGDSMVGAGILDGDYVLSRRQHNAESGDIVVFIIGDEITVKKYDTKGDKVLLIPTNEAYETRIIKKNSSDLQIAGKVIGLLRKY